MIISFYSYKGGVGRTQLCANTAAYLYFKKDKRILLWDWDFEAPGLHYFFNLKNKDIKKNGTIELLEEYMNTMRSKDTVASSDLQFITKEDHIMPLLGSSTPNSSSARSTRGCIDLMAAGNYENDFSRRTNAFDWFEFYSMMDGANYIELVKSNLEKLDYDYIFIDSRTGISDYSGICNIQLPDINVIVAAPTLQNFEGCRAIVSKIENAEYYKIKNQEPKILPILSRLDSSNPKSTEWATRFSEYFRHLILKLDEHFDRQFLPEIFTDIYCKGTFLYYTPAISAGENILFDEGPLPVKTDYRQSFITIAEYIESLRDDGYISFYRKIDEDSWLKYADIASNAGDHEKAAIAFNQVGIKQLDPHKAVEYFSKALAGFPSYTEAYYNLQRSKNELKSMETAGSTGNPTRLSPADFHDTLRNAPAPNSPVSTSKVYRWALAIGFVAFVIYRIIIAVLENNDEKNYRTALAALSQLTGQERQQAICLLARNKNTYNNKFISTMKDSLIVQCSQIELVVKETDSTIRTYSTEISKLQQSVNASPKLMDKSKTIDSFDNKLQLKKDSLTIVKDAGQRERLQQDTASIRKDIQNIIQKVPEFQGAQYPLQEIKRAITKQDNIINQSILHEDKIVPGYPRTSWFKEGYYLQFDSIHITLYDLNKQDNSILVGICPQVSADPCTSPIGGPRVKVSAGSGYSFQYGGYDYILKLSRIGSAGNNPFKPAAYISLEKYKR